MQQTACISQQCVCRRITLHKMSKVKNQKTLTKPIFSFIRITSLTLILATIFSTLLMDVTLAASAASSSRTSATGKRVSTLKDSTNVDAKLSDIYDNQITGTFFFLSN